MDSRIKGVIDSFTVYHEKSKSWVLMLEELKRSIEFPFKCPVCRVRHRRLSSALRCINKISRRYSSFTWEEKLSDDVIWEAARRGISDLPKPPRLHVDFFEDWMIAVDQNKLRMIYKEFIFDCRKKANELKREWNLKVEDLVEKINESNVIEKPKVLAKRGDFYEIVWLEVNGVNVRVQYLINRAIIKADLPKPYAELDDKGRGKALNYDLYAVDPSRNLVIIQQRKYLKIYSRWYPTIKRKYYLVSLETGDYTIIPARFRREINRFSEINNVLIPPRISSLIESI